jgi:hypothetical protein
VGAGLIDSSRLALRDQISDHKVRIDLFYIPHIMRLRVLCQGVSWIVNVLFAFRVDHSKDGAISRPYVLIDEAL